MDDFYTKVRRSETSTKCLHILIEQSPKMSPIKSGISQLKRKGFTRSQVEYCIDSFTLLLVNPQFMAQLKLTYLVQSYQARLSASIEMIKPGNILKEKRIQVLVERQGIGLKSKVTLVKARQHEMPADGIGVAARRATLRISPFPRCDMNGSSKLKEMSDVAAAPVSGGVHHAREDGQEHPQPQSRRPRLGARDQGAQLQMQL